MNKEKEIEALSKMVEDTFRTENEKNVEKYLTFFHDDLISLPPGAPITRGKGSMREDMEVAFKSMVHSEHELLHVGISDSEELGWIVASYRMVFDGPDGQFEDSGKFHCTMRKTGDGWKFLVQSWNNDG